jgi:uncharacterized SAM-binding protein YcdF (DUF218 family)
MADLGRRPRRRLWRWLLALVVIVGLIVGTVIGIGYFLSPQSQLHPADLIVAISGGETQQRTSEAVQLYKAGYAPLLLFSGAAADRSGPSNAAAMRADAIADGVPPAAILIEENSTNTAENATETAPIIHSIDAHTIILVTSPYHQRRASIDFHQALGSSVTIINHSSSDSIWRKSTWWQHPDTIGLSVSELQKILFAWSTNPQGQ